MAACGKRFGKGTIAYPCVVEKTQENPDPEFGGFHPGPCAAVENQQSMMTRQRWESGAGARATLHAHQSAPQTFAQTHGAHDPTPVPGSGLQPAEHRATFKPVMGGFGEQPVAGPPCEHPFGAIYVGADGATICGQCGERLREPEVPVAPEGTLRSFVHEHQAPPEVLVARAEADAAALRVLAAAPSPADIERVNQETGDVLGGAIATAPPVIEGAEPFPGLPARPPLSIPRLGIQETRYVDGTEVQFTIEGHARRGRIVPVQGGWDIPAESYAVQATDDDSIWSVAPHAITAVFEQVNEHFAIGRDTATGDPIGFHKTEPTKQRPGDQVLPNQDNGRPAVQDIIIAMATESKRVGIERYGQPLRPMNGRDTLQDMEDEARDLFMYATTWRLEREEILERFERAYGSVIAQLAGVSGVLEDKRLEGDLDAVLAWLRGAPQT